MLKNQVWYEVYRNGILCCTVMSFLSVVNFIFDDYKLTNGQYEYTFKEKYVC